MSVGFIMYEIVDKDSLKYQGINTHVKQDENNAELDIHLKIKVLTPTRKQGSSGASWIFT